jgi:DNA-binding CsgD family transcriptional regulator
VREAREGSAAAIDSVMQLYADVHRHRRLFLEEPAAAAWLTRLALAVADHPRAVAVVTCVEQLAADNDAFSAVRAAATHARGVLDSDAAALDGAAATHRQPWASASAAEDAGVVRCLQGERTAAQEQLEAALTTYERIGADRDAGRVRRRIRAVCDKRRSTRAGVRNLTGWHSLTHTEERVVAHVAQGLTNREVARRMFLSRHTIDSHLRQAFRKLGVTSRVQVARLALEHGGPAFGDVTLG